jgi:hypothetical protein
MVTDAESEKLTEFLAMKRMARYLERGRYLAGVGSSELKRRGQLLYREWSKAKDLRDPQDHRLRQDIESELELRGEELPVDPVDYKRFRRAFLKLRDDPTAQPNPDRPNPDFDRDFQEFLRTMDAPH